jgi:hypothetical protein
MGVLFPFYAIPFGSVWGVGFSKVYQFGQVAIDDNVGRSQVEVGNMVALQEDKSAGEMRSQLKTSAC